MHLHFMSSKSRFKDAPQMMKEKTNKNIRLELWKGMKENNVRLETPIY